MEMQKSRVVKENPRFRFCTEVSRLAEIAAAEGLHGALYEKGQKQIKLISTKYNLTSDQAILYAVFMNFYDYCYWIDIDGIAKSLKCGKLELLPYEDDILELEKRHFILRDSKDTTTRFNIPREALDALKKGIKAYPPKVTDLTERKFKTVFQNYFGKVKRTENQPYYLLVSDFLALIKGNQHISFCKNLLSYSLSTDEMWLLAYICYSFIYNSRDEVQIFPLQEHYFDENISYNRLKRNLHNKKSRLITQGLLEETKVDDDGDAFYSLTNKAKNDLLDKEITHNKNDMNTDQNDNDEQCSEKNIPAKELFFNNEEAEQIARITTLITDDSFKKACEVLGSYGMRTGFACLFHGAPGTGKTETVKQLARKTNREIVQVDISSIVGSYVGDFERNIKQIFDSYREKVEHSTREPILFFNEADGLFTSRINLQSHSANQFVSQEANRMQNIILEELENLKGILIATTNLAVNMDKAFDRRFLFKVEFKNPDEATRVKLWKSMLPELNEKDRMVLGRQFKLSGGQIENITRKYLLDKAIFDKKLHIDDMVKYCKEEVPEKLEMKIGF